MSKVPVVYGGTQETHLNLAGVKEAFPEEETAGLIF